jgi:hypothetical protein
MTILRWARCFTAASTILRAGAHFHRRFHGLEMGKQMIPSLASVITPRLILANGSTDVIE